MNKSPVVASYHKGLAARNIIVLEQGPLRLASYKLSEVVGRLNRLKDALSLYGPGVRSDKVPYYLGPCMGYEAESYFKKIPGWVGFDLGRDVVGVLDSLVGDGMSIDQIQLIKQQVTNRLPYILSLGDAALTDLLTQWQTVAGDRGGRSTLDEYQESCVQLIETAMREVP